jgi:hypothetical protein
VGSGLILLVIVGAWLAVLVPMALRSHDQHSSAKAPEKFGDAMRVLARRSEPRTTLVPRRPLGSRALLSADRTPKTERVTPTTAAFLDRFASSAEDEPVPAHRRMPALSMPRVALPRVRMPKLPQRRPRTTPLTLADRRRRVLLTLLGLGVLSLLVSLVGPGFLRVVGLVLLGLAVAFVVHCRRQAILKSRLPVRRSTARPAARPARQAPARRVAAAPRVPRRIPGVPDAMPARPAPLSAALPAPAARYDEAPAAAASGTWDPKPVPPPTYVGKPVAPPRPRRILDLTRPGEWSAALDADDSVLAELEDGKELDVILERRRAVGGW